MRKNDDLAHGKDLILPGGFTEERIRDWVRETITTIREVTDDLDGMDPADIGHLVGESIPREVLAVTEVPGNESLYARVLDSVLSRLIHESGD